MNKILTQVSVSGYVKMNKNKLFDISFTLYQFRMSFVSILKYLFLSRVWRIKKHFFQYIFKLMKNKKFVLVIRLRYKKNKKAENFLN